MNSYFVLLAAIANSSPFSFPFSFSRLSSDRDPPCKFLASVGELKCQ